MNTPNWLKPPLRLLLSDDPQRVKHLFFVLASAQLYAVNLGIAWHSVALDVIPRRYALVLTWASVAIFLVIFTLVRSGWSRRFKDPVLALPYAQVTICMCFAAYTQLGASRADTMILIAEAMVMSMFRLRPGQMLWLGLSSVAMLAVCASWLTWKDPVLYPASTSLTHFVVGGSALLILALVAKWVTDIRMRISSQAKELSSALQALQHMATQDSLTGLINRRVMTDLAEVELKGISRSGAPLTVALLDLDHFKHINDQHGHAAGDAVLTGFAAHATAHLRQVDKVARWGGEEFLVLMPQVSETDALAGIERLRLSMGQLSYAGHPHLRATFSAGLAQALPGEPLEHLVERADRALYLAKQNGRDRTELASQFAPSDTPSSDHPAPLTTTEERSHE